MAALGLLELLGDHTKLSTGTGQVLIHGVQGSGRAAVAGAIHYQLGRQTLLVTSGLQPAERLFSDLKTLLPQEDVVLFPSRELLPNEEGLENVDLLAQRMEALCAVSSGRACIVVAPYGALIQKLMPPAVFRGCRLDVRVGGTLDVRAAGEQLVLMGYERVDMVEGRKQFSVRGGILDVFPLAQDNPVRVELFDDEVDSIREFDVTSQRSRHRAESVSIGPAREFMFKPIDIPPAIERIFAASEEAQARLTRLGLDESARSLKEKTEHHIEQLDNAHYYDGVDQYLPFFYEPVSFLDYFMEPVVAVDDADRSIEHLNGVARELHEALFNLSERGRVLANESSIFADADEVMASTRRAKQLFIITNLAEVSDFGVPDRKMGLSMHPPSVFHGKVDMFLEDVKSHRRRRGKVLVFVSSVERARRLEGFFRDNDVDATFTRDVTSELVPGNVVITLGALEAGFEVMEANLTVFTDLEVYGQQKRRRRLKSAEEGIKISSFTDLRPGDHVVHINHGIGKYIGIVTLTVGGAQKDYLHIKYAGEDKLYVPTDQTDLLQRYIGAENDDPKLNKLGGQEWAKVKNRVKESVREMAQGLLELYAQRETVEGHAFSADTVWQREFEGAFPYDETPDQERVIEEIRRDMERSRPMDRLLCGDVGYGKTEVAMRAAFKAVMDNKQVAILVPTTILAQQHLSTFTERFKGFPVNVAAISRFQSQKEQAEALSKLKRGELDVIIGTHRLLQKDIVFKDLGLLVVDEEQRFGVAHKEKIKELRKNVDVLTLTATPIPRTLHMSLVGVRDVSLIETPPENRFPVRTSVCEYDEQILRDSIRRELDRQGQIYFIYNRVQTMDRMVQTLRELVPEAEIATAHGQMDEHRLERVMVDFYEQRYDVLVCTTIIETGMDISNVNTIFIYDADYFGLAQLYQLRGRVGRTNRVAHAYLFYRREKALTEVAEKRLSAIKEFTDFGSGFKIAMRDLEIRGAGNLLGPEQHGHVASVGFELYCRLLEQAVQELKGQVQEESVETSIDVGVDAFIPPDYIEDERQKIGIYKRIASIRDMDDSRDLIDELVDRYGEPPQPVVSLMGVARIKAQASRIYINSIMTEGDIVVIRFRPGTPILADVVESITRRSKGRVAFQVGRAPQCRLKVKEAKQRIPMLETLLTALVDGLWAGAGVSGLEETRAL